MTDNKYKIDSKENLGHGIKGEVNPDANDLKSDKKEKRLNNNK